MAQILRVKVPPRVVMENGLESPTEEGVPQGGPLSPILSDVCFDKFDRELESRGLHFVRCADDCNIFVKSEMAADRVMKSVTGWLERKLFLKVSATKTNVVRPTKSEYLGFGFWKSTKGWQCKPLPSRKQRLYDTCKAVPVRKRAAAIPLVITFRKVKSVVMQRRIREPYVRRSGRCEGYCLPSTLFLSV